MATGVRSQVFQPFGDEGPTVYLSNDNNAPASSTDPYFDLGDWIINTAPVQSGVFLWVVCSAGQGNAAGIHGVYAIGS